MSARIDSPSLVSVIVATYNDAATLARCLDSLREQTWPSLEVILVDDGSDAAACQSLADLLARYQDTRIKLHAHGFNRGLACARNTGLSQATGEWIAFVDADDWVAPDFIGKLMAAALRADADVVNCRFAVAARDREGQPREAYLSDEGSPEQYGTPLQDHPNLLTTITLSMNNKLFARALFDDQQLRFPEGRDYEDLATCPRLLVRARRITLVDEALYHYDQGRAGSLMSRYDSSYLQVVAALAEVRADWHAQKVSPELMAELRLLCCRCLLIDRLYPFLRLADAPVTRAYLDAAFCFLDEAGSGWRAGMRAPGTLPFLSGAKGRVLGLIVTHERLLRLYAALLRLRFRGERTARAAQSARLAEARA